MRISQINSINASKINYNKTNSNTFIRTENKQDICSFKGTLDTYEKKLKERYTNIGYRYSFDNYSYRVEETVDSSSVKLRKRIQKNDISSFTVALPKQFLMRVINGLENPTYFEMVEDKPLGKGVRIEANKDGESVKVTSFNLSLSKKEKVTNVKNIYYDFSKKETYADFCTRLEGKIDPQKAEELSEKATFKDIVCHYIDKAEGLDKVRIINEFGKA